MQRLSIGSFTIPSRVVLAPLAGISDLSFRMLNRRYGCCLAFIEMLSARSLVMQAPTTRKLLQTHETDKPLGVQLVGKSGDDLRRALDMLHPLGPDLVDLNAACPVKKVIRRGEGASLLQEPRRLETLLRTLVRHSPVPVSVKIRAGWDMHSVNAVEVAQRARDAGVQAVVIHGRTRSQLYKGRVNYGLIRDVVQAVTVPVIGSGDVFSPQLAQKMLDETGCAGVAVARGALGNPWIFRRIESRLAGAAPPGPPGLEERMQVMLDHLGLCTQVRGEQVGVMLFRKFFGWYTKGFSHIRPLRSRAFCAKTHAAMAGIINELRTLKGAEQGPVEAQYPWADIGK